MMQTTLKKHRWYQNFSRGI